MSWFVQRFARRRLLRFVEERLGNAKVLNLPRIKTADASSTTVPDAGLVAGLHLVSAPCLAHSCVLAFFHAVLEAWSRPGTAAAARRSAHALDDMTTKSATRAQ